MKCALILLLLTAPVFPQQKSTTTQNPLDTLHDQAKAVFERAGFRPTMIELTRELE